MRALIMIGETGQLTFYDEVGQRLERMGFEISLCCDRDDPGVADAVNDVATRHNFGFFVLRENFSLETLTANVPICNTSTNALTSTVTPAKPTERVANELHVVVKKLKSYATKLFYYFLPSNGAKIESQQLQHEVNYHRAYHRVRKLESEKLFVDRHVDILILGEDGIGSNLWAISSAKHLGIRVVVIPYGMAYSNFLVQKGLIQKQAEDDLITVDALGGRVVKKNFPNWIKNSNFGEVLYFRPSYIIALEKEGIKLRDPWCLQGGEADIILSEGLEMSDRYILEGVPKDKLMITGSIYSDVLFDHIHADKKLKAAFNRNTVISKKELRVLVCVPPSESVFWSQNARFSTLSEFYSSFSRKMKNYVGVKLTYSFHPRLADKIRQELITIGIYPSELAVFNLIANNDLVIMHNSSLCRWAIQAKKPVINYDFYGFGTNYFPDCDGYYFTRKLKSFLTQLDKIILGEIKYETLSIGCNQKAERMGIFDGRCAERMADEIKKISSETEKQI